MSTRSRRERFPACVTGIVQRKGMTPNVILQDARYPADFGPNGRITGIPPNFFMGPNVQGFSRGKEPRDYENFGSDGLTVGVSVWAYHLVGSYETITYVRPRDEAES